MAPGIETTAPPHNGNGTTHTSTKFRQPLKATGALDAFKQRDMTPIIGTEFPEAQLIDWINSPQADEMLRDLAIKISERGVVFFRKQRGLSNDAQKALMQRLGELTGKPATSRLHIHPVWNSDRELGDADPEISTISSVQTKQFAYVQKKQSSAHWHNDIAFEPVPAEYTCLRLTQLPPTGGDTLWASGYELYDRISAPYRRFLESLSVTFAQPGFKKVAEASGLKLFDGQRGSPENVGSDFSAVHPVVRTNPVTGWKSLFPIGFHVQKINGVTDAESKGLLDWFLRLVFENHDLQVRFRWEGEGDMAIWDNRSVFHTATFDLEGQGERFGVRAVGIGERPYFDPESKSRREALGQSVDVV
ncbi:TfdA family taurine dioxygenase [Massariosphaeria phaeospora]|uniref:TfdA family taurine dioxygenase n=1 Tax=Massariosphaeria phaeospora TaxID=100035 RepID=A0A7C8M526_9PLEO|nr:TfdA family taurine dioxygenase [Massariosphaeria phaeospora]